MMYACLSLSHSLDAGTNRCWPLTYSIGMVLGGPVLFTLLAIRYASSHNAGYPRINRDTPSNG